MNVPKISIPWLIVFIAMLTAGIYLRLHSYEKIQGIGFDEGIYRNYVEQITKKGWTHYPDVVASYIEEQIVSPIAFLPPTRISFLLSATAWHRISRKPALECVRAVSTAASILLLLGAAAFSFRLGGYRLCMVITAFTAFAPLEIYMSHRALIDGFFAMIAFFVLWFLWETLQNPMKKLWLSLYGVALALLVLTKENAAFVYAAVIVLLCLTPWLKLGKLTKGLIAVTLIAPAVGAGILVFAAGDVVNLIEAYRLNVKMSYNLPYAITTGDGPWFRYLSDLILTMPVIIVLAIGGIFRNITIDRRARFFLVYLVVTYIIMGNLRYGMNLRYGLIWDFPLFYLAATALFGISDSTATLLKKTTSLIIMVLVVITFQISNYLNIFVRNETYDIIPVSLMQALKMIK